MRAAGVIIPTRYRRNISFVIVIVMVDVVVVIFIGEFYSSPHCINCAYCMFNNRKRPTSMPTVVGNAWVFLMIDLYKCGSWLLTIHCTMNVVVLLYFCYIMSYSSSVFYYYRHNEIKFSKLGKNSYSSQQGLARIRISIARKNRKQWFGDCVLGFRIIMNHDIFSQSTV